MLYNNFKIFPSNSNYALYNHNIFYHCNDTLIAASFVFNFTDQFVIQFWICTYLYISLLVSFHLQPLTNTFFRVYFQFMCRIYVSCL